jgi:hypothetical protein
VSAIQVIWTTLKRQNGTQTQERQECLVIGTTDKIQAELAILANSAEFSLFQNGQTLGRTQLECDAVSLGTWKGAVVWGAGDNKNSQTPVIQFDTDGGEQTIFQSIQTYGAYVPQGAKLTNFNGAIGVTKDGVEGAKIIIPGFKWTEKHWLPMSLCNGPYLTRMASLAGKLNQNAFRGFGQGEVWYLGATGGGSIGQLWEVTHKFSASRDVQNLVIGVGANQVTGINKPGWAYLWIRYQDQVDPTSKNLIKLPQQVNVEQTMPFADFSQLGIPQGSTLS